MPFRSELKSEKKNQPSDTKMKTPQLLILLVILLQLSAGFPTNTRDKHASWDDVNVVAHGLLQLGQGLKEHVDKTKAQMRDVNARLKSVNSTVAELERRQREQAEALKARGKELEEKERLLGERAEEVRVKVEEVKKQSEDIYSRMDKLEEKLDEGRDVGGENRDHPGVSFIQRMLVAQNRRIDLLVEKIKQQQDKLEKQSLHLQALQTKAAHKRMKTHRRRDQETPLRGEAADSKHRAGRARDCHDLFVRGYRASGVFTIKPEGSEPFSVFCEMTAEGGWTVIQRRYDGSQDFNQLWESYKKGFGSLNGEFWLGLENIRSVSKQGRYVLQVELTDGKEQQLPVTRYRIQLDGEEKKFSLHLQYETFSEVQEKTTWTGASGIPFSTVDRDNDLAGDINCAELFSGGWWFSSCGASNLNGRYPSRSNVLKQKQSSREGMFWTSSKGQRHSVRTTLLKIRPAAAV